MLFNSYEFIFLFLPISFLVYFYLNNYYFVFLSKKYNLILLNKLNYLSDENFGDGNHLYNGENLVANDILNLIYSDGEKQ